MICVTWAGPGLSRLEDVLGYIDDVTLDDLEEALPVIIFLVLLVVTFWVMLCLGCYLDRRDRAKYILMVCCMSPSASHAHLPTVARGLRLKRCYCGDVVSSDVCMLHVTLGDGCGVVVCVMPVE